MLPRWPAYRYELLAALVVILGMIWTAAAYDLQRSRQAALHEAELRTATQAQMFAEFSRSTIKRIDEVLLNLREEWQGDWNRFAVQVQRNQRGIDDVIFQVAVIDAAGIMQFSNLARPDSRVDLSEREHFRVHRDRPAVDQLFISRPVLGKVSGKWSIQLTRPVRRDGHFAGVIVASLDPAQFVKFAARLAVHEQGLMSVIRASGEVMAHHPEVEGTLGTVLKDRPFLGPRAPVAGNYQQVLPVDGKEHVFGFARLPDQGLIFVLGETVEEVLAAHEMYLVKVLGVGIYASLLAVVLLGALLRSLDTHSATRRELRNILELSPDGYVSFDAEGRVRFCNPAFERMTGIEDAQARGLTVGALEQVLAARCGPGTREELTRLHETDLTRPGQRQLIELTHPQARVLEVSLRHAEGQAITRILHLRDVTREVEMERTKSDFLTTAAQELRAPLASIHGYAELLVERDFKPEEAREFLGIIQRQSAGMSALLDKLLALVQIERKRGD